MRQAIELVQRRAADAFDVSVDAMTSPRRMASWARPRQVAMYLSSRLVPGASLPMIGRRFGNRDHTTVIHAVRTIERLCADDAAFNRRVTDLSHAVAEELKTLPPASSPVTDAAIRLAETIGQCTAAGLVALAKRDPEAFVRRFMPPDPLPPAKPEKPSGQWPAHARFDR